MNFDYTPNLSDGVVELCSIKDTDFELLYACASDKAIWAEHPCKDRYKRSEVESWFDAALKSDGALKILDMASGDIIGSSRYYEYCRDNNSVAIGYTFLATAYWGGEMNRRVKGLMLTHAFNYVGVVWLHIASANIRSQKAAEKIGAVFSHQEIKQIGGKNQLYNFYKIDHAI